MKIRRRFYYNNRVNKRDFYLTIGFFFLFAMTIGYAYLTTSLTINGTAEISKNTWDIHFENLVPTEGNKVATTPATIKDNATLVDFAVALTTPGDYYSFNVDIVNNGSINAMLADVLITGISTEQAVYLEQAITYSDGKALTKKDALGVGDRETIKVLIKYKMDITESQLPTTTQTLNLSLKATYSQDDGTSIKRPQLASKVLFTDDTLGANGKIDTTDSEQTFITGTNPNNYIWYSGKLWRAVSLDTADNSVKLVTQWNQTGITYNVWKNTAFSGSYVKMWLNDIGSDGFLGTLYNYTNFIKTDSQWNATLTSEASKPVKTTMVTDAVGLLNIYEYTMSYNGTTKDKGYLNNELEWWTLTPYSSSSVWDVDNDGGNFIPETTRASGVRPSINLKSTIKISGGDGTESNPYTLKGDSDKPSSGTLLNTRKSGEYINFGNGNIYRIVNVEDGKTKIVSSEPLKTSGNWKELAFDTDATTVLYTPTSTTNIGYFLNNDFLNPTNGYITSSEVAMLETNNNWYLGTVGYNKNYSLGKCTIMGINCIKNAPSVTSTVGMLRLGEQLSDQFNRNENNVNYWALTPYSSSGVWFVNNGGFAYYRDPTIAFGVRPSVYLKSNIKISGGSGTKQDPFTISS